MSCQLSLSTFPCARAIPQAHLLQSNPATSITCVFNCWSLEPILGLILTLNTQYARFGFLGREFEMGVGNGNYNIFGVFVAEFLRLDLFNLICIIKKV